MANRAVRSSHGLPAGSPRPSLDGPAFPGLDIILSPLRPRWSLSTGKQRLPFLIGEAVESGPGFEIAEDTAARDLQPTIGVASRHKCDSRGRPDLQHLIEEAVRIGDAGHIAVVSFSMPCEVRRSLATLDDVQRQSPAPNWMRSCSSTVRGSLVSSFRRRGRNSGTSSSC